MQVENWLLLTQDRIDIGRANLFDYPILNSNIKTQEYQTSVNSQGQLKESIMKNRKLYIYILIATSKCPHKYAREKVRGKRWIYNYILLYYIIHIILFILKCIYIIFICYYIIFIIMKVIFILVAHTLFFLLQNTWAKTAPHH